jgi:hypothetical protein
MNVFIFRVLQSLIKFFSANADKAFLVAAECCCSFVELEIAMLKPAFGSFFTAIGLLALSVGCQGNSSQSDGQGGAGAKQSVARVYDCQKLSEFSQGLNPYAASTEDRIVRLDELEAECIARSGYFSVKQKYFARGEAQCGVFIAQREGLNKVRQPIIMKSERLRTTKQINDLAQIENKIDKLQTLGEAVACFQAIDAQIDNVDTLALAQP